MPFPPRHQRSNALQRSGLSFRNFSRVAHPHFTRVTAKRPTIKGNSAAWLILITYELQPVAYHAQWRHAKQLRTSITGMSAAWLILITHELQPSGLSCLSASCQIASRSITGISAAWLILTTHELPPSGLQLALTRSSRSLSSLYMCDTAAAYPAYARAVANRFTTHSVTSVTQPKFDEALHEQRQTALPMATVTSGTQRKLVKTCSSSGKLLCKRSQSPV